MKPERLHRALVVLDALAIGDAFGEAVYRDKGHLASRTLPPWRPLRWTDDTAMAISIVEALAERGDLDGADLAARFARAYRAEPWRGYGMGAQDILQRIGDGEPWDEVAESAFDGQGSRGNGGAMRAAPIGAWFADDLDAVVAAAARSATPTHAHADGAAGAIAVAVAAAVVASGGDRTDLLEAALARTPTGPTLAGIAHAARFAPGADPFEVARAVGNGSRVIASDTVPFCLWSAASSLDDFEAAMWRTASVLGDMDTNCAIVAGIVAASGTATIPPAWREAREPLPPALRLS